MDRKKKPKSARVYGKCMYYSNDSIFDFNNYYKRDLEI